MNKSYKIKNLSKKKVKIPTLLQAIISVANLKKTISNSIHLMELIFLLWKKNKKTIMTELKLIKYLLTNRVSTKIWVKEDKVLRFPKRKKTETKIFLIWKKNHKILTKWSFSLKIKLINLTNHQSAKQFLLIILSPIPQLREVSSRKKGKTKKLKISAVKKITRLLFLRPVKFSRIWIKTIIGKCTT